MKQVVGNTFEDTLKTFIKFRLRASIEQVYGFSEALEPCYDLDYLANDIVNKLKICLDKDNIFNEQNWKELTGKVGC